MHINGSKNFGTIWGKRVGNRNGLGGRAQSVRNEALQILRNVSWQHTNCNDTEWYSFPSSRARRNYSLQMWDIASSYYRVTADFAPSTYALQTWYSELKSVLQICFHTITVWTYLFACINKFWGFMPLQTSMFTSKFMMSLLCDNHNMLSNHMLMML